MKESDLFVYLKNYFEVNPSNEIFTEVVGLFGGRPDIVVRNKKLITIIEMKTTLSMDLLEQVMNWRYRANYIYIAIPRPKKMINRFAYNILKENGIGILYVEIPKSKVEMEFLNNGEIEHRYYVTEYLRPKLFRVNSENWEDKLKDIYRCENNIEGGSRGKGYNTPYKAMIHDVKKYIHRNKNAPIPLKELIETLSCVRQHYSNPKASLYSALTTIESKDVISEVINGQTYFSLTEEAYNNFNVYDDF